MELDIVNKSFCIFLRVGSSAGGEEIAEKFNNYLNFTSIGPSNFVPGVSHLTSWGERGETLAWSAHVLL